MKERREQYKAFVKACFERNLIVGQGNPLSSILFVGCEPNSKEEDYEKTKRHIMHCLNEDDFDGLWVHHDKKERNEGWTWRKYQKIIDKAYPKRLHDPEKIDFEEVAFCTELNNVCSPTSEAADKSTLPLKLQLFKESRFIQGFPVVILACGPKYIVNRGNKLQINDTFGVKFVKEVSVQNDPTKRNQRFWIHYDDEQNPYKMVIHTRQLSGTSTPYDELLWSIGDTVRKFLDTIRI